MPLILAIVADPHEAAQLAQLVEGRLSVDLVQAAEAGEGLLALDDRIPDLILTSPFMSPFDDGVLDEYLRDLGPAGAHVQTLRIPVLSQAPKKKRRLGFSLRRSTPAPTTLEGCEPKVFADEIAQYLERAVEEKRHASANGNGSAIARAVSPQEPPEPEVRDEVWSPAYLTDEPDSAAWLPQETEADQMAWRSDLLDRSPDVEASTPQSFEPPVVTETEGAFAEPRAIEPFDEVTEPAEETDSLVRADTTAAKSEVRLEQDTRTQETIRADVSGPDVSGFGQSRIEDPPIAETPVALEEDAQALKASPSFQAALEAIRAAWGKPSSKASSVDLAPPAQFANAEAALDVAQATKVSALRAPEISSGDAPTPFEVDLTGEVETLEEETLAPADPAVSSGQRGRAAGARTAPEAGEVYELSVEPDLRELETRLLTPPAAPEAKPQPKRDTRPVQSRPLTPAVEPRTIEAPPAPPVSETGERRKKSAKRSAKAAKTKSSRPQPPPQTAPAPAVQDEWGIFDPKQCGFAALVEKLDEVSDEKPKQPRNGSKTRVISFS
jgi:hypothetical protein